MAWLDLKFQVRRLIPDHSSNSLPGGRVRPKAPYNQDFEEYPAGSHGGTHG